MLVDLTKSYQPKNFLDLYIPQEVTFENSEVVVVPFGYEGTVTFGHGTNNGPKALIEASWQVELFDDELLDDIQNQIKIWTVQQPQIPTEPMAAAENLAKIVGQIYEMQKFPVVIGGEHSISYGFASAISKQFSDISILVFDSHLDLIDQYFGNGFYHGSWLKYALDLPNTKNACLLGIRNYNKLEWEYWKNHMDKVTVFEAKEKKNWRINEIVNSLSDNVYLSFDIDAFDSSVMPSTGTPEPGGLFWDEVLPIIRVIAQKKNIIGIDLVELSPIKGLQAPDFVAAKLLMKMILYKFSADKFKSK